MSYLFRALYNYNRRYLVNFSFRRDGASVFKYTGNTWDNFYSVGAGWIMSEENFMRNQHVIDYLKIKGRTACWVTRTSVPRGGNYPAFPTLNSSNAIFGDNIISSYAQAYLATNLRWEKTKAWEVGFEMQMFNQRLHIEPTYYSKKTEDLICYLESFMGAQDGLINSGFDPQPRLRAVGIVERHDRRRFPLYRFGNLTTIDNEVLTLGKTYYQGDKSVAVSEPGKPIGYFYGYEVEGHLPEQGRHRLVAGKHAGGRGSGRPEIPRCHGRRQDHRSRPYDDRQSYARFHLRFTRSTCNTRISIWVSISRVSTETRSSIRASCRHMHSIIIIPSVWDVGTARARRTGSRFSIHRAPRR